MPADVPVDEPPRRLATDAWLRWYWLWEIYFAIGYVAIVVLLLNEDDETWADHLGAITAITLMAVWYVGYGRGAIVGERPSAWRGRIFMTGVVALLLAGVVFQSAASFALFAVCPFAFMALDLREAIFVVIPANLMPVLGAYLEDGPGAVLGEFLPGTLLTLTFAVLLGTWIHRIVAQSEERAVLIEELEASREEISRLSRETGIAAERSRLAAEIHDTLAQGFTSLVTLVQAAESELDRDTDKARRHLTLAARTARENLTEARALVAGLMPSALGTGSLDQAIRRQLERFAEETPAKMTYVADGDSVELPTVVEVVLLRAVQESLTNVRKHSGATEVAISLRVTESCAALRVTDNGAGFDPTVAADGFGLRGMRSRAAQIGGKLTVHSGTDGRDGTTVELEVPR